MAPRKTKAKSKARTGTKAKKTRGRPPGRKAHAASATRKTRRAKPRRKSIVAKAEAAVADIAKQIVPTAKRAISRVTGKRSRKR